MRLTTPAFKDNARGALADPNLQESLGKLRTGFQAIRADAVAGLPDFEALRDTARDLKDHTLANLDEYLTRDRKSTRLNSSHVVISYAVLCSK